METFLSLCLGIGLAAACGFRVFVPLLVLSIATHAGHVTLAPSFDWIGSTPALISFSVATVLEIGGYYIPWLDNMLDSIATPAAVIAGTVVTAAVMTDISPYLQWSLALIAGGSIAGLVQGSTVATRLVSTSGSAGLANPVVATAELGLSGFFSAVSMIFAPLAFVLVLAMLTVLAIVVWRRLHAPRKIARPTTG